MSISVDRKPLTFNPDSKRVVARFFQSGEARSVKMINKILTYTPDKVNDILNETFEHFKGRHRNLSKIFQQHCGNFENLMERMGIDYHELTDQQKMLIGAYSTMEYSIESAALFNPSIIEDLDQSFLKKGEKRVILSFRATGEGHLSSIVFRRGVLDAHNQLHMMKVKNHVDLPEVGSKMSYDKGRFITKMEEMHISKRYTQDIINSLGDKFEYYDLKNSVNKILEQNMLDDSKRLALEELTWLVDSYYDLSFHAESDISERVIFPNSPAEVKGIEDARFVRFMDDDDSEIVYATYTAYNGYTIIPKLLSTQDFQDFRIMPIHGTAAQNKNFALFPRKIKGKYATLARIDGMNNYIIYSDRVTLWNDPIKIQTPEFSWDLTQIGNCGSPIETDEGWLVLTHGVGPMRRYCIAASLFDLDDPTKEIGRLKEPLLSPLEEEREGYVPNVVYSCGGMIHNGELILPYAVSDYSSSYATVNLKDLLRELKK
ncbi:MAG TPA: glycoside hydrolase family 130 protein [Aquaticitalea sp.]|nr:glycoside hydrolase family 130 protein [Aquaticitalea sp.]